MAFLLEDTTCIYDDNITCIDGKCSNCEIHLKQILKWKVQTSELAEQITIEDILNGREK